MDSSGFIHSREGLENTDKYGCWYEDDPVYNFIRLLDRGNWLRKVMDSKRMSNGSLCLIDLNYGANYFKEFAKHSDRSFMLANRLSAIFALSSLSSFSKNKVLFLNSFFETELLQRILSSRLLEKSLRKRLLSKIIIISESGLLAQLYEQFILQAMAVIVSHKFYPTIQSLVDDRSKVENLPLSYFKNLLFYLFAVYLAIFLACFLHHFISFLKKRGGRSLRISLIRYKIDLDIRIILKCPTFRR